MTNRVWIVLLLLASIASGAVGFSRGVDTGAEALARMDYDLRRTRATGEILIATSALQRNDQEYSRYLHQIQLRSAVHVLGALSTRYAEDWTCSERDRTALDAARALQRADPAIFAPAKSEHISKFFHDPYAGVTQPAWLDAAMAWCTEVPKKHP